MSTLRKDVLLLSMTQFGFSGLILWVGIQAGLFDAPGPWSLALTAGFLVAGSLQINIELRRSACGVSFAESALVVGLLWLEPSDVIVAAVLGEALFCLGRRQPPERLFFNVSAVSAMATVAAAVFALLPDGPAADPSSWANASIAAITYGAMNHLSTVLVLASVEARRFRTLFAASFAPAFVATGVATSVGILTAILAAASFWALLLVAPIVALVILDSRRVASHSADRLRFERLYDTTSRTARLQPVEEAVVTAATEARELVTGQVAICCVQDKGGHWWGVVVDDEGVRNADDDLVRSTTWLGNQKAPAELPGNEIPASVRAGLPVFSSAVVASTKDCATTPLVLVVLRDIVRDSDGARPQVLDAFLGHASLTITNALLYADVEQALVAEVDLHAEKDAFLSVVSHELRTPLAAMMGAVETLQSFDGTLSPEQRATLMEMALRRGDRLQRLIQELLLAGSGERAGEAMDLQDGVELDALVAEVVDDVRRKDAGHHLDVRFESVSMPTLRTDRDKLRQILANLIENAHKYAPDTLIEVLAVAHDGSLVLDVVDHGAGIPECDRERIFERFVQLDQSSTRRAGGTGLGLFLSRRLAGFLGGTLTLTPVPDGGCCFRLILPLVAEVGEDGPTRIDSNEHMLARPN